MHNPESVLENEMRAILWDFDIQTDHRIPTKRPDHNKKKERKKERELTVL